jgi:hypothetical protein
MAFRAYPSPGLFPGFFLFGFHCILFPFSLQYSSLFGILIASLDAKVKQASEDYVPAPPEEIWVEESTAAEATSTSDPTLANVEMTELEDTAIHVQSPTANGFTPAASEPEKVSSPPSQTSVGDIANPVAEENWDHQTSTVPVAEENWDHQTSTVPASADGLNEVPREPAEIDTGAQSPPSFNQQVNSWAEDLPPVMPSASNGEPSDGFEQVIHHQRQNNGRGRGRGRMRGDGFRGRGRGEFRGRGRGRGDYRGGRGRSSFAGPQSSQPDDSAWPLAPPADQ